MVCQFSYHTPYQPSTPTSALDSGISPRSELPYDRSYICIIFLWYHAYRLWPLICSFWALHVDKISRSFLQLTTEKYSIHIIQLHVYSNTLQNQCKRWLLILLYRRPTAKAIFPITCATWVAIAQIVGLNRCTYYYSYQGGSLSPPVACC